MNKFKYISTLGWITVGIPTALVTLAVIYSIKNYRTNAPFPPKKKTESVTEVTPKQEPSKIEVPVVLEEPKKVQKRSIKKETTNDSSNINDSSYNSGILDSTTA